MSLHRDSGLPARGLRETAAVEEQDSASPRIVLAHLLRECRSQRESAEDEVIAEVLAGLLHSVHEGREPDLLGVGDSRFGGVEGPARVDVGSVDGISGQGEAFCDGVHPGRPTQRRVEKDKSGHAQSFRKGPRGRRRAAGPECSSRRVSGCARAEW